MPDKATESATSTPLLVAAVADSGRRGRLGGVRPPLGRRIHGLCRRWGMQEADAQDVLLKLVRPMQAFRYHAPRGSAAGSSPSPTAPGRTWPAASDSGHGRGPEFTSGPRRGAGYSDQSRGQHPPTTRGRERRGAPGYSRPANWRSDARPARSAARGGPGRVVRGLHDSPRRVEQYDHGGPRLAARAQSGHNHGRGAGPLRVGQERP